MNEEKLEGKNPEKENEIVVKKAIKKEAKKLLGSADTEAKRLLVIRHDKPKNVLPIYEPLKTHTKGIIDTPFRFLQKRVQLVNQLECTLLVNRDAMTMKLTVNEFDHYNHKVDGKLELHPDFIKFNVNTDNALPTKAWAKFFRMNRAAFDDIKTNIDLVTLLSNFSANVDKIVESKFTTGGDRKELREQTVKSNLPAAFHLTLPIFKGFPAKRFQVEIVIDPDTLSCSLESPEAQELLDKIKNSAIDDQINQIIDIAPELLIVEE